MTTTHDVHVRSDPVDAGRRPVAFFAAGVAAAVCFVVGVGSFGGSGASGVSLDVVPVEDVVEPVSALLDGRAFAVAVEAGVSGLRGSSILLDGAAFELAVNDAIAFVTNGSALLHGTGFADAVAEAVAAATD